MVFFIYGLLILVLLLVLGAVFVNTEPAKLLQVGRGIVIVIMAAVIAFLLFTGRFGLAIGAGMMLAGLLRGANPFARYPRREKGGEQASQVRTEWLEMRLDHESGEISGRVLQGVHVGRALDDLAMAEVKELYTNLLQDDPSSAQLLDSYALRRFGGDWRDGSDAASGEAHPPPPGGMSREEALEILGLDETADEEAIHKAYKQMICRVHPDQGGSSYLAAKINQARDVLLKEHR